VGLKIILKNFRHAHYFLAPAETSRVHDITAAAQNSDLLKDKVIHMYPFNTSISLLFFGEPRGISKENKSMAGPIRADWISISRWWNDAGGQ